MSIVSYAQNFEDVMLWRALKHVENGFYIDIGANEPTIDSVSKAFYEKGWRGVHVEPSPEFSEKLKNERPDETIEQVLISNQVGEIKFYQIEGTGLSTADYEVAKKHETAGFTYKEITVPSISLDRLLQKYGDREIHWLKIDVEGYEESVLDSWVNSKIRPWILVIESTQPLSTIESHHDWERRVIDKGYAFAYFDGLNRFYIHESKSKLISCFSTPPNVFDGFALSGQASNAMCSSVLEKVKGEKLAKEQAEAKANIMSEQLNAVYQSHSWRITAPLRWLSVQLNLIKKIGIKKRIKALVKKITLHVIAFIKAQPVLKSAIQKILIKTRLYNLLAKLMGMQQPIKHPKVPTEIKHLTPCAQQIYYDLKTAMEKQKGQK